MDTSTTFQLFPMTTASRNKHVRNSSQQTATTTRSMKPGDGSESQAVVIAITEMSPAAPSFPSPLPKAQLSEIQRSMSPATPSFPSPLPKAQLGDIQRSMSPPSRLPPPPPRSNTEPSVKATSPKSSRGLMRSASIVSSGTHSPVMRSMFPRYDPSRPLAQQKYYPDRATSPDLPRSFVRSPEPSPSLYSEHGHLASEQSNTTKAMPYSAGASSDRIEEEPIDLSTPEELTEIWNIANGQESHEAVDTFTLGLKWYVWFQVDYFTAAYSWPIVKT